MHFDRWTSTWPRSWPYALFKKHHTELNDYYWSNAVVALHAIQTAQNGVISNHLDTVMSVPQAYVKRLNIPISTWIEQFKGFENWTRLNSLMALSSYFETYLKNISTLALTSDPGCLIASPRSVDGIALVKKGLLPNLSPTTEKLTHGDWNSRLATYKQLFGKIPYELQANITELEKMRKLRNGIGHSFGRFIDDYRSPLLMNTLPAQKLSETRLQNWLGIVENCVNGIEEHLRTAHIGAIEVLLNYHLWDKKYSAGHTTEAKAFRSLFPPNQGRPPSHTYFGDAIAHYKKV